MDLFNNEILSFKMSKHADLNFQKTVERKRFYTEYESCMQLLGQYLYGTFFWDIESRIRLL